MEYNIADMFGIEGDTAVIIGAAGGIGKEIALAMVSVGAKVALVDVNREKLDVTVKEFTEKGFEVMGISADITNKKNVESIAEKIVTKFGRVDILVNCAGVAYLQDAVDFDEEKWDWVMNVNVKGTLLTCQVFGKYMVEQKKGRIVNFSSVRGLQGRAKDLAYAPSKGAVNQLTKSLAIEWAKDNVNVNAIAPIFTLTDINRSMLDDKKTYDWVIGRIPKGKLGETSFLTGPTIFLCSPCSEFVTGHILYVDGGWAAG